MRVFPPEPPEYFNFAHDVLAVRAADTPHATAILSVDGDGHETRWSFGLVHEQSARLAHVLRANGLERGARAVIVVASLPFRVIAQIAVMKVGAVSVLARSRSTSREIADLLERAPADLAIAGPEDIVTCQSAASDLERNTRPTLLVLPSRELDKDMRAAPPSFDVLRLRSDEPAQIALTGGTTGPPKMVVHTHGSKLFHYLRWTITFDRDDLSWDLSGKWWMGAWRRGLPVFDRVLTMENRAAVVLETLTRYPITRVMASAALYRELTGCETGRRPFAALRACWSSGHPLDLAVRRAWIDATGIAIHDRYSQTECGEAPVRPASAGAWSPGCIGRPFPWVDMAIIDTNGERVAPGVVGDIAIRVDPERPAWLFREYWRDPDATAARFRGGWYLTGDYGRADPTGVFILLGRSDDIINCGGENIGPEEFELLLIEHPAVLDAAVVGRPDRVLGEVPKAFVVPRPTASATPLLASELMRHVNGAVHISKRLRDLEFVTTLPRSAAGKLLRRDLRERERLRLVVA